MTIPLYFSHSYRAADQDLCLFFGNLLVSHGFALNVDPKSATLSTAYLEHLMSRSAGFAAILTKRPEQRVLRCSPYAYFEYQLACQARKPKILFVEKGVGAQFRDNDPEVCVFSRDQLESKRWETELGRLYERSNPNREIDVALRGTVALLLGERLQPCVQPLSETIKVYGFKPVPIPLATTSSFELLNSLDGCDFVILDLDAPGADWLNALMFGRSIPTLKLFRVPANDAKLPSLVTRQLLTDVVGPDNAVVYWHDEEDLNGIVDQHLKRFEHDLMKLRDAQALERYIRSIGRSDGKVFISNANDGNQYAQDVSKALRLWNINQFHYRENNSIPLGVEWQTRLLPELESSTLFVPLLTKGYSNSEWCVKEMELALQLHKASRIEIIPYFLETGASPWTLPQGRTLSDAPEDAAATIVRDIDNWLRDETKSIGKRSPQATRAPSPGPHPVDVAFLTILPEEYDAVLGCLDKSWEYEPTTEAPNQYAWKYGEVGVEGRAQAYRVVLGMAGQAGTASGVLATLETVEKFSPTYVVLVGIAGGLKDTRKGDVVVADVVWGYEYGKIDGGFRPRQNLTFPVDRPLVRLAHVLELEKAKEWRARIRSDAPESGFVGRVLSGPVASGDKVVDQVDDSFFAAVIRTWPSLVAVEMEGAGAANAVHELRERQRGVGFAMIRGISDVPRAGAPGAGGSHQTADRDAWKKFAARSAAAFATSLLRLRWPVPPRA